MSLRDKTLLYVGLTILVVISVIYVISRFILLQSYGRLEDQYTRRDVNRAVGALYESLDVMDSVAQDWAAWDDTYQFVETKNQRYIERNYVRETFEGFRLNFIIITDMEGRPLYAQGYDYDHNRPSPVPQELLNLIAEDSPLLPVENEQSFSKGILMLPEDPALVVSRPILTSNKQGPVRGTIVVARYLTLQEIERLEGAVGLDMSVQPLDAVVAAGMDTGFLEPLSGQDRIAVRPVSDEFIRGYTLIDDLYDQSALLLSVTVPRSIYQQGRASLSYFVFLLLSVGGVFSLISILLLERQILTRLAYLTKRVLAIGESGNLSERIALSGSDELSTLAGSINDMLEQLAQATEALRVSETRFRKLAETSAAIIFIHQGGRFRYINPMGCATFGYNKERLLNMGWEDLISQSSMHSSLSFLGLLEDGKAIHIRFETEVDTGIGDQRFLEVTATPFEYEGRSAVIGTAYDVTERKLAEEQMRYLSNHDSLTGLYNRAFFEEELVRLERGRNFPMSVVIIDIDGLKPANDTLGHAAGDELIRRTARVLKDVFRAEDVIARIGGDEFAVLLPGAGDREASETHKRIREELEKHNRNYPDLPLRFSLGIATGLEPGPLAALMQKADELMYKDKITRRRKYAEQANYRE